LHDRRDHHLQQAADAIVTIDRFVVEPNVRTRLPIVTRVMDLIRHRKTRQRDRVGRRWTIIILWIVRSSDGPA
jgi:hypothetical protein